jgi:hypothetical protein
LVPTTTLFLDFGEAFGPNGVQMTVKQLRDTFNGPDLKSDLAASDTDTLTFRPLSSVVNFDYDGDGVVNSLVDANALERDVVRLVQRYYAPFDVNVQMSVVGSLTGVTTSLAQNGTDPTGHDDAYVFVTPVTTSGAAFSPNLFGIAAAPDIGVGNTRDDSAVVFADHILASTSGTKADTALASVAAHEAGHTFGLQHTVDTPPGSDAEILARSDIMSQISDSVRRENYGFFTRFPLATVSGTPATENPFLQLANDADIGPAPNGPAYVTGTGAHDRITLTRQDATHATVTVQAFRLATYLAADQIGNTFTYTIDTSHGVLVEAGFGDDRIEVDARLATNVRVRGMAGNDQLVVLGNGVASGTYRPGATAPFGLDGNASDQGTVTAGGTTIAFEEFEPAGSVQVQDIPAFSVVAPLTFSGSQGAETLTISSPAAGQNQVSGDTNGVSWVPLTTVNVGRLTVDTGSNDNPFTPPDQVTVRGLGSPVTVTTGATNDVLTVDLAGGTPLPAGGLTFDGGTGVNSLILKGASGYNSETYSPTGPASGTIDLRSEMFVGPFTPPPSISYSNVQQITDTAGLVSIPLGTFGSVAPRFTLNATAAPDTVSLANGTPVGTLATLRVSSPTFATITFANKPNVYLYGLGGVDTFTVNYTTAAGLTSLLIDGGTENDTVNVQQTVVNVPLTINGGDGDDTVNLGNDAVGTFPHGLDAVRSPVTVNGQGGTNDTVNLLDGTSTYRDAYTITDTTVGRPFFGAADPAPPVVGLTYDTVENLVLQAETSDGTPGSGNNTITISALNPATLVTVSGNGGTDTLVGPNLSTTWHLLNPGPNTLDVLLNPAQNSVGHVKFTTVENLTGGTGTDVFQFAPGSGVGGRIDGGGGANTLDYSQYVGPYGAPGVTVTLADAPAVGTATGTAGVINIQNVFGSHGNDHITGNSQANTLATYGGLDVLMGGRGPDTFYIYGEQYTGTVIDGGTETDTLYGANATNTWFQTGLDVGAVSNSLGSCSYTGVENLVGGLAGDTFRFLNASAAISGTLNGNSNNGGADWLDYSQYPGAVTVNLQTGSATGVANGAVNHVFYIEDVLGARNAVNTLTGASTAATGNALGSVLVGGKLNDTITGGVGRSLLIGGDGIDGITGGSADDIVIGGWTDWDSNTTALTALLAEWSRTDAATALYSHRIDDLRTGTSDPGRLNGSYFLNAQTVHDDGKADVLRGGPGTDWFWANVAEILDKLSSETAN